MEENIEKEIIKIWEKSEEEFETMKKIIKKLRKKIDHIKDVSIVKKYVILLK
ncbi:MAG: hypothetical protein ACLSDR_01585 [Clostridium sp.]